METKKASKALEPAINFMAKHWKGQHDKHGRDIAMRLGVDTDYHVDLGKEIAKAVINAGGMQDAQMLATTIIYALSMDAKFRTGDYRVPKNPDSDTNNVIPIGKVSQVDLSGFYKSDYYLSRRKAAG